MGRLRGHPAEETKERPVSGGADNLGEVTEDEMSQCSLASVYAEHAGSPQLKSFRMQVGSWEDEVFERFGHRPR